jgi:hypothetical protein
MREHYETHRRERVILVARHRSAASHSGTRITRRPREGVMRICGSGGSVFSVGLDVIVKK